MIPTTILIECGPCDEVGRPIDLQPTLTHPLGQRWRDIQAVFDKTVGVPPLYVMSLTNGGRVLGAWSMYENVKPLEQGSVRLFQESPSMVFALGGPVAASEYVLIAGSETFRTAAKMAVNDALGDHHVTTFLFDQRGENTGSNGSAPFVNRLRYAMDEDTEDRKARLWREIDRIKAMYDGRIPDEVKAYEARLRSEYWQIVEQEQEAEE